MTASDGDLYFFFPLQGTGGSPTGPDPENRVSDQDTGSPVRPVSSGLQVPGGRGIAVQEQDPLVTFPRRFSFTCTSSDE